MRTGDKREEINEEVGVFAKYTFHSLVHACILTCHVASLKVTKVLGKHFFSDNKEKGKGTTTSR